jgi:hypothetical protein
MLNLLTEKQKKIIKSEYRGRLILVLLVALSLTALIFLVCFVPFYYYTDIKEEAVNQQFENIKQKGTENEDKMLAENLKELKNNLLLLKPSTQDLSVQTAVIKLTALRPDGIKINSLGVINEANGSLKMYVQGVARSRESLQNFKKILEQETVFKSIELPTSNILIYKTDIEYTINLIYKKTP